jgi:hypothetical protein
MVNGNASHLTAGFLHLAALSRFIVYLLAAPLSMNSGAAPALVAAAAAGFDPQEAGSSAKGVGGKAPAGRCVDDIKSIHDKAMAMQLYATERQYPRAASVWTCAVGAVIENTGVKSGDYSVVRPPRRSSRNKNSC